MLALCSQVNQNSVVREEIQLFHMGLVEGQGASRTQAGPCRPLQPALPGEDASTLVL